jgi:hypothetical protein
MTTGKQPQRQRRQQIPFGDDNKKGNRNGNDNSRSPSGMTTGKATAAASLVIASDDNSRERNEPKLKMP